MNSEKHGTGFRLECGLNQSETPLLGNSATIEIVVSSQPFIEFVRYLDCAHQIWTPLFVVVRVSHQARGQCMGRNRKAVGLRAGPTAKRWETSGLGHLTGSRESRVVQIGK